MTILFILSLIQSVTLRGTVWEGADKPAPAAIVTVVGVDGTFQATSGKDGAFTLSLPRPGTFQLSAKRGNLVGHPSTIFLGQDMDGVGIVLRPLVNPLVMGSVKVEEGQPLPAVLPRIVIKYTSGTVAGRFEINRRGLFFFAVSPAEFSVSLAGLEAPYYLKSMMSGDLDLTKNPFKRTDVASIEPIVITLGIRK